MDAIDTTVNARGAFLAKNKPGWHGLGEVLPHLPMEVILQTPGINYTVGIEDIYTATGKQVLNQYATVRSDNGAPLSVVGEKYTVLQHTEEMKLLNDVIEPLGYDYETVGVLHGGREVFLLANRPGSVTVAPGDDNKQYLGLFFSYDGKRCQRIKTVNERVVCANTQAIAFGETGSKTDIKLRHTLSITDRMQDFRDSIAIVEQGIQRFEREAMQLVGQSYGKQLMRDVMTSVIENALGVAPKDAKEQAAYAKRASGVLVQISDYLESPTNTVGGIEGTRWSLYNAISEWADHTFALGVKGTNRAKAERRFVSVIEGHANDIKQAAWQQLLAA